MQTITIGKTRYTIAPSRNVGELQRLHDKCTGAHKSVRIPSDKRDYPQFRPGIDTTADYVRDYYKLNSQCLAGTCSDISPSILADFFEPLPNRPSPWITESDIVEDDPDYSYTPTIKAKPAKVSAKAALAQVVKLLESGDTIGALFVAREALS